LIVTVCPHALGLAIPLVIAVSIVLAAQKGLVIRSAQPLSARKIGDALTLALLVASALDVMTLTEEMIASIRIKYLGNFSKKSVCRAHYVQ
jgi:hypothetical protein